MAHFIAVRRCNIEFVKDYSEKNNISWNCAICQIKENNLYKPLNKKKQKEEEKKKDEILSEKILLRSINSYDDFYYVKSAFLIEVKNFKNRLR